MRLIVGCPVYERAWILERWFDHLSDWPVAKFVFIYTPGEDNTGEIITRRAPDASITISMKKGLRDWVNRQRIDDLVALRNQLRVWARYLIATGEGDTFFSLDSDILVPPWEEARPLFYDLQVKDAVAPLVFLGNGAITNVFVKAGPALTRAKPSLGSGIARVICAAKLMSGDLVMDTEVAYTYHRQGEDFGWSESARAQGYKLGFNFQVKCKHVMKPENLDVVDRRIGW